MREGARGLRAVMLQTTMLQFARPAAVVLVCALPCHAGDIGVTSLAVAGGVAGRPLALSVWYPSLPGEPEAVGANAIFVGALAGRDAPVAEGRFPLAVLTHGGLRSAADSGAWLGAGLAGAGFVAVEVNALPPDRAGEAVDEIWRRPEDVSRALDSVMGDPAWAARIDGERIGVVGFALGGTAAIALAGNEMSAEAFARVCDGGQGPDCTWFAAEGVSPGSVAAEEMERPHGDSRLTAAVAIAPEYLEVFAEGDLAGLDVLAIALGEGGPGAALPASVIVREATMPDGFSVCTPAGPSILAEEDADPELCGAGAADRERAHAAILRLVVEYLSPR